MPPVAQQDLVCHSISGLIASGGFFDGARFDVSSGLNCIIGNRGTGRTTALELIRYALDDLGSDPKQRRRVEAFVQQNLGGGRVELEIETADGIRYTISRTAGEAPIVYTADGEPTTVSIGAGGIFRAEILARTKWSPSRAIRDRSSSCSTHCLATTCSTSSARSPKRTRRSRPLPWDSSRSSGNSREHPR